MKILILRIESNCEIFTNEIFIYFICIKFWILNFKF